MRIRKFECLVLFIFLAACTQMRAINLPEGIKILKGVNPVGLQSPIWSPDGKRIAAAYVIEAMPDIAGFFGPKPRHDVVIIDTETWKSSVLADLQRGYLAPSTWLPDSKSFALLWPSGPEGTGIYLFDVDNSKPTYFSEWGALSPSLEKIALSDTHSIKITDRNRQSVKEFKTPVDGEWGVYNWSPDMKLLPLLYRENEKEGFNDIYLLEVSSGKFSQFTHDKSYIKGIPIISPNGRLIAYTLWRFAENDFENKLIISNLDQSCQWTVPINDIQDFAWSPDSQRMFLVGNEAVYLADLNVIFGNNFSNRSDCP